MSHPIPTAIDLRTVDRFEEPLFTDMVDRLLHDPDRPSLSARLFDGNSARPTPTQTQQVRIGAFAGERLVGWSHAFLQHGGALYVSNSGVEPEFRRQGVYTRLVKAMEEAAHGLGCLRIESHHRAANHAVLIAKLKLDYTIVGTEFTAEMGLLVKLARQLDAKREAIFQARSGVLEGNVRWADGLGR